MISRCRPASSAPTFWAVLAILFGPQLLGIYSPSAGGSGSRYGADPLDLLLFYGLDALMDVIR